ncbi:hypothetical protein DAPPUDRAFT_324855 [Daphnia pulex]|uniref:DUF4806 domain-containing protein n=1 Tax=Daphnia pulex TaxID=6669 RepID=E9H2X7_DAPPU|nr:hypothetical protein DAPPUDRAFT_324855 [Daphnia pulex]|eukprot:EFX73863.1 hypothetical protein DAPPUDRAFT_324855 [Daphnia pulex]
MFVVPTERSASETGLNSNQNNDDNEVGIIALPSASETDSPQQTCKTIKCFEYQNRYLRVMARELAEVKADVKDLRRLLLSRKSLEDFKYFEEELLKEDVKLNLIEMLQGFFEKKMEDTIRRIWKEIITNELMRLYTWMGTPKPNSGKQKGLAVIGSRLSLAVIEAVKHEDF